VTLVTLVTLVTFVTGRGIAPFNLVNYAYTLHWYGLADAELYPA